MSNPNISDTLRAIAADIGLYIFYKPVRHQRGWPRKSARPFGLYYKDGTLLATFPSLDGLERNLRARAGC